MNMPTPTQAATTFRRARRLPIRGEVLVACGQQVAADTPVARAEVPGVEIPVEVATMLAFPPILIDRYMVRREGDLVKTGQGLARRKFMFGLSNDWVVAPRTGYVESISKRTGTVILRTPAVVVERQAYLPGRVVEVLPAEGAVIESRGIVQSCAFGVGNERSGRLLVAVDQPGDLLEPHQITRDMAGAVVVCGSIPSHYTLIEAARMGVAAVIAGSSHDSVLAGYLGYELGVPITGQEDVVSSLILTEGFGETAMREELFCLLKQHQGETVSVNGTTHLRSHLIRPEIVIPVA